MKRKTKSVPRAEPEAAPFLLELARLRAQHHVRDAARILTDAAPYMPLEARTAFLAITGELTTLERHLAELQPEPFNRWDHP